MPKLMKGLFIAIEGIDGSGKSSVVKALHDQLTRLGYDVISLKEPTNESEAGRKIRQSYITGRSSLEKELEWFIEDREWDVKNNILPALEERKIVLLDRYYFSTAAYQGARKNNDWQSLLSLNRAKFPEPDLTIIVDVTIETSQKRIQKSRNIANTFEDVEYQKNVRLIFLEIVENDSIGSYFIIDGEKPLMEVIEKAYSVLMPYIKKIEIKSDDSS